jgi:type II secretory pathway pseudopilin PulG
MGRHAHAGVWPDERGFLMVALLVAMSVMAIAMSVALPTWRTLAQREKEAELIFRGEQYGRAITLFQRRYGNSSPPNLDVLVNERFLRKKYLDPMTGGEFALITSGQPVPGEGEQPQSPSTVNPSGGRGGGINLQPTGRQGGGREGGFIAPIGGGVGRGGIIGVVSRSTERSFRLYNGRDTYSQWVFMGVQQSTRAGGPGGPAGPGRGGRDGRGGIDGRGGRDGRGGFGGQGNDGRGGRDGRGLNQPPPGRGPQLPFGGRGPGGR